MTNALAGLLTTSEIRTIIKKLMYTISASAEYVWAWSNWRLRHQKKAAEAHRKMRSYLQL